MPCRLISVIGLMFLCISRLAAQDPERIHLGIVHSLVKDQPPARQKVIDSELSTLVEDFTGLKCRVSQASDPFVAAKKLSAGEWHLCLFHGVEFAWTQSQNPKLKPFMLAIYKDRVINSLLVAKKDSGLTGFADVKGKNVNLLTQSKVHCRLFADKGAGGDAGKFFGKLLPVDNGEAVFDDILLGKVEAAVADQSTFDIYKDIHPGRHDRLKVLVKSEPFPPVVVAIRRDTLSERLLAQFRDGMLKAGQSDKGRESMANFRIARFETVPSDYAQLLADIAKAYPPPAKE